MRTAKPDRMHLQNYVFGSTSAIITNISLIVGLGSGQVGKIPVLGALLTLAVADNISDSLGIHMYKESEGRGTRYSLLAMASNFSARLLISLTFIAIVLGFTAAQAGPVAVAWGLFLLMALSYRLSRLNRQKPLAEIARHLVVAVCVIIASHFVGLWLANHFRS